MSAKDIDESLWSDDDTEGPTPPPAESAASLVQKLTWQNHELRKEITDLKQTITDLEAHVRELQEIELKRVEQKDFKPAIMMASAAPPPPPTVDDITVPASLFSKLVIASHGATQIFLKIKEGIAEGVFKK